jgi:hypothetical protein
VRISGFAVTCARFEEPSSVIPTRYFLGRPEIGEEMHIEIEKGKTLIIRLMAVGPVVEGRAQRDVWFEVNGEVKTSPIPYIHYGLKLSYPHRNRSVRCQLRTKTQLWKQCRGRRQLRTLDQSVPQCQVSLLKLE